VKTLHKSADLIVPDSVAVVVDHFLAVWLPEVDRLRPLVYSCGAGRAHEDAVGGL